MTREERHAELYRVLEGAVGDAGGDVAPAYAVEVTPGPEAGQVTVRVAVPAWWETIPGAYAVTPDEAQVLADALATVGCHVTAEEVFEGARVPVGVVEAVLEWQGAARQR